MFSSEAWLANPGANFYNGVATQSLRFDDGSSAYLTRTPSSAGNRKTWTWSGWFKRGNFVDGRLFSEDTNTAFIGFSSNKLIFRFLKSGANEYQLDTTQLFRDVSAWYHIVCLADSTQGTASDRMKLYVNGNQVTDFSTANYVPQNTDSSFNNNTSHDIGALVNSSFPSGVAFHDGYLAEVNFIDGLALTPTSFGETKNGAWIPIDTSGLTFGTNGFRLKFDQVGVGTASTTTIGADTSGNTNHYTSSGIVASDCNMPDSPENNFCTINPLDKSTDFTLSEGNLKVASGGSNTGNSRSTFAVSSGKWYWEARVNTTGTAHTIGITTQSASLSTYLGNHANDYAYARDGTKWNNNSSSSYGSSYANGDNIGIALDLDNGTITFYKNGSSQGTAFTSLSGEFSPALGDIAGADDINWIANFGQDSTFAGAISAGGNADGNGIGDFAYAPPSGYLALCTSNLPEPTISPNADTQADDYFNTVLFTGNGGTQAINDVGFQSDWVWIKNRNGTGIHGLFDSSRGVTKYLSSNSTNAEATASGVTSFDSNGFSLGSAFNQSSLTFVAWNWLANGGTTSSNTDGSITSTVQASTDAGFSIVQFVGDANGSSTVGHGLSKTPNMVIVKPTSRVDGWAVYHSSLGADKLVELHSTNGEQSSSGYWGSVTSSVFGLSAGGTNNRSGATHIAYCFAEIEGYSKFGSYTGNGSADGTFVYTGFRPAWIMVKTTNHVGNWIMHDSTRSAFNVTEDYLVANDSIAEGSGFGFDFLSNGFKARSDHAQRNGLDRPMIYMAFASNPFKYSTAK